MPPITIDPTVPETPPGSGIRWDSGNQTWVDTRHGYQAWNPSTGTWGANSATGVTQEAPAATTIAPSPAPPSLPAQTASAGNIATLSGATLNNANAAAVPANTAATTANAAANTSNAATNATIAANTALRNQQLHEEALAAQGLTQQQITNAYNSDLAKFGIDRATLLLTARQAAAKSLVDSANFQLSQNAQNAQARQTMASQQLDALKMLQARSGPQDYTRWDYITGMGGNAPKPQDSRTYSPLDMIAAQYQPSNIAAPAGFDASGIDMGAYPGAAPAPTTPAGGGTIQPAGGYAPSTNFTATGPPARITPPNSSPGFTSAGGIDQAATPRPTTMAAPIDGYRLASGGSTSGAALVGDAKSGKPTGHEEVAYASNNPQTGVAELHVIPHHMIAGMMDEATGRKGGLVMHANKVPKEMARILPRAATGGTFSADPQAKQDTMAWDSGKQTTSQDGSSGVPQYQPSPGMTMNPDSNTAGVPQFTPSVSTGFNNGSTPVDGYSRPGGPPQSATGGGAITPTAASTSAQPSTVGGVYSGSTAAPPPQSLGPAGYDPYRITVNQYSPDVMNNSPLLQMLRGQMPVYGFQGQGSYQPGIQSQGITNLPIGLNYGDYLRMDPTRQAMLKGIYENPETGESFDQILAMAKAAAPKVGNFRVASAR